MCDEKDYPVGYGKPPEHTRFKPGRSGNPNGRPKKTRDLDKLFEREFERTLRITENGELKTLTMREAFVKSVMQAALKGDRDARRMVFSIMKSSIDLDGFEVNAAAEGLLDDFLKQWQQQTQGDGDGNQDTDH